MVPPEFAANNVLDWPCETRSIEWKRCEDLDDKHYRALIARAVMAMANTRGGGHVLVGVAQGVDNRFHGVPSDKLVQWEQDHLADILRNFMTPPVPVIVRPDDTRGVTVVILEVPEFDDQPILCTKDDNTSSDTNKKQESILKRGACYIRPRSKVESCPVGTYEDMRDLLDLATEKAVRKFLELVGRLGLVQRSSPDDEWFRRERKVEW